MNLFEITDDFSNPKHLPEEDLKHLEIKNKRIQYELNYVQEMKKTLQKKIAGNILAPMWNTQQPDEPSQQEAIEKIINSGYTPIYTHDHTSFGDKRLITMFIPNLPENRDVIKKITRVNQREMLLSKMQREIPIEIKRAKGRISAWKRKQPNYVGRATGKELLTEIRDKVQTFLSEKSIPADISNNYYWAKNKMIVIEVSCRSSHKGLTPYAFAKQEVKPMLVKFLEELGYTQFRVTDRFIMSDLTVIKIQLDDVEAKNKAGENETK